MTDAYLVVSCLWFLASAGFTARHGEPVGAAVFCALAIWAFACIIKSLHH